MSDTNVYEPPKTSPTLAESPGVAGPSGIRFKLSVMMFLEFFIWGAWLPLIFGYLPSLGFSELEKSWVLNAFAIASFVGMFFSNQFADRNFAAEKFLAVSHLVGGLSILALGWVTDFWLFFALMLVHSLFYVPTISITNSIAFANLTDAARDFPRVRLWGTIGWIAASWPFVFILVDWAHVPAMSDVGFVAWLGKALGTSKAGAELNVATTWTFIASGIASLLLAAFSLSLPHTPPKKNVSEENSFALLESLRLLQKPFVLVLFLVTFVDAAVHQCYFIWTNDYLKSVGIPANWVMPIMSIGQLAEIGTMFFLGYCLKSLGWRYTMVIGILGHAVRFGVFAFFPFALPAIAINVLHGVCYAFFFATVYIFVDEFFPKDARTSAQGLFNFLILGFGPFVANFVWPSLGAVFKQQDGTIDFQGLFLVPAATAFVASLALLFFFHPPAKAVPDKVGH
jgi:nucleoside transporter